jgi:hypothetical protein
MNSMTSAVSLWPLRGPRFSGSNPARPALEEYAMGRMPVSGQAGLENHVQGCSTCCRRLEETFSLIQAVKTVLSEG